MEMGSDVPSPTKRLSDTPDTPPFWYTQCSKVVGHFLWSQLIKRSGWREDPDEELQGSQLRTFFSNVWKLLKDFLKTF